MTLRSHFFIATALAGCLLQGASWKVQYFYDRTDSRFGINDFQFVNTTTGFATGFKEARKDKLGTPYMISTTDGGKTWKELFPPAIGENMFFLNEKTGWLSTNQGVCRTDDAGVSWKILDPLTGVTRLWFLNDRHGFAVGIPKLMKETKDGGATWTDVTAAKDIVGKTENTAYTEIVFQGDRGVVAGVSIPNRPKTEQPAWVDPSAAARRRQWPTLTLSLATSDAGETWKAQTTPLFGTVIRMRAVGNIGMSVIRYSEAFDVPSEVYAINAAGRSQSVYKKEGRIVTDAGWIGADSIIVAVEAPGKLNQLPFPGKIHVLKSLDLSTWTEMDVSYKAFGGNAMLAAKDETHAWIATDAGMILSYIP